MTYEDLFKEFNNKEIKYVVIRRYDELPEKTVEGSTDVDILIDSSHFKSAIEITNALGFNPEEDSGPSRLWIYRRALSKPGKAVSKLVQQPKESLEKVLVGSEPEWDDNRRHESVQLYRDSQVVDLQDNLAYKSPMKDMKIPVDPSVTGGMLRRRNSNDCFFIPSPPDELAHLIPHCVFNKDGYFSPYYENRCTSLFAEIQTDEEYDELFNNLLEKIFFKASELVYDSISEGDYANLREKLERFSNY